MYRKQIPTGLIGILALGLVGCSGGPQVMQATSPPGWVDKMPKREGVLCAVGYSGPTFNQQDCLGNAADNGRGHLADTISAKIRTLTIDISDGTRGTFSRDVFVQGSETASNAVLQGSEVEAQWMDVVGMRGSPKGCYAWVCIDPSKPIDSMVKNLEKKLPPKTVEQVRANAEAAFEDLEKEEAKRAAPPPPPPPEPEKDEPAKAEEPAKADEPAKAEEPAKADEPAKAEEPAKADEPAKAEEPARSEVPAPEAKDEKPAQPASESEPPAGDAGSGGG